MVNKSSLELEQTLNKCNIQDSTEHLLEKIETINRLKQEKNAVILAHYYMRDSIKIGIADYVGDSLDLSKSAMRTEADLIVFCGVDFMAETAKILNPHKKVILPSREAGCSLAESITAEDVKKLRKDYPDAAIATYINTTADVKAECDVCVTSANAPKVISRLPNKRVVFIPDNYMARNLENEIDKEIIFWDGTCVVHEQFNQHYFREFRSKVPGLKVLAHYECDPSTIEAADMHGSTSDMRRYVGETDADAYLLATECGLASTIIEDHPEKKIIGPCMICPYMKEITIDNTLHALTDEKPEITISAYTIDRARISLERMFALGDSNER